MNPFARPHFCDRCHDTRRLATDDTARATAPCEVCGVLAPDDYARFVAHEMERKYPKPDLRYEQLTAEQREEFARLRAHSPNASYLTVLSWIEGTTYDPAEDPVFMTACRKALSKWRFALGIDEAAA